jgi:hypothetical protein
VDQICYSREGISVVAGLLTATALACTALFGALIKFLMDQIKDLRSQRDRALKVAESQAETLRRRRP